MNYPAYITLVGWETCNWRHRDRALVCCKDYGLVPITKHVFVGELYAKERREMEAKLRGLFTGKKERLFFATMCRSCFNENMIGLRLKGSILNVQPFELVQMSKKA